MRPSGFRIMLFPCFCTLLLFPCSFLFFHLLALPLQCAADLKKKTGFSLFFADLLINQHLMSIYEELAFMSVTLHVIGHFNLKKNVMDD